MKNFTFLAFLKNKYLVYIAQYSKKSFSKFYFYLLFPVKSQDHHHRNSKSLNEYTPKGKHEASELEVRFFFYLHHLVFT